MARNNKITQLMKMMERMQITRDESEKKVEIMELYSKTLPRNSKGRILSSLVMKRGNVMEKES